MAARARRPARCRVGDGPGSHRGNPLVATMTAAAESGIQAEDFHEASRMSTITGMAILVVDDDQAVRDALRRALTMQGYDVDIPRASANTVPVEAEASQVILNIKSEACQILTPPPGEGLPANCRVSLDDREIPVAELPLRVKEILGGRPADQHVLFLAADDRLNYEGVLRIVDLAKSNVDDLTIEYVTTN